MSQGSLSWFLLWFVNGWVPLTEAAPSWVDLWVSEISLPLIFQALLWWWLPNWMLNHLQLVYLSFIHTLIGYHIKLLIFHFRYAVSCQVSNGCRKLHFFLCKNMNEKIVFPSLNVQFSSVQSLSCVWLFVTP